MFLLDASSSVTQPNFNKILELTKYIVNISDIDSGRVRVAVAIYSSSVAIQFELDDFTIKTDIIRAIDKIPYIYGSSNTYQALRTMRTQMFKTRKGDRDGVQNYAILVTDGVSNINEKQVAQEAKNARAENIHIYAVGIGLYDTSELVAIATPPANKNSFVVENFDKLLDVPKKMFKGNCESGKYHVKA